MAKGAYYQGLRYSNQGVKPVDFGAAALNFAKEYRFQKEKRDNFLMEQQEKYADIFTLDQLNAGLSQPDAIGDELQARLLSKFNAVNEAVNAQQMSLTEARAMTNNYKGQLMSLKQSYDQMGDFVNKYNELGEEGRGESMNLAMEHLNEFMNDASITEDKDGRLYISKLDPETGVRSQPLANIKDLFEERGSVSIADDIAKPLFSIDSKGDKLFSGSTAYTTFLESGNKLSQAQKDVVKDFFKERYDDRDLMDLAKQYDVDIEIDPNEFKLANRKAVEDALLPKIQESIRDMYELRQYEEDNVSLILGEKRLQYNRNKAYGSKKEKYTIYEHENGNAVFNPDKDFKLTKVRGVPVPEGANSEAVNQIAQGFNLEPGAPGVGEDPFYQNIALDVENITVRDFHLTSDGQYIVVNGTYTPTYTEEGRKLDASGKTIPTKTIKRDEITHGSIAIPIQSIEAQDIMQTIGMAPEHRSLLYSGQILSRSTIAPRNRMNKF